MLLGVKIWNNATNISMFRSAVKRHYVILTHESEESSFKSKVKLFYLTNVLNEKNTLLLYHTYFIYLLIL